MGRLVTWRDAMASALYGETGFFIRSRGGHAGGSAQFRTSANASPLFAAALLRLVLAVDEHLGRPDPMTVLDVGAGGGALLSDLAEQAPPPLRQRLRLAATELAPRPPDLPAAIAWSPRLPEPGAVVGVVLATEWLDNVPLDIAETDDSGVARYVLVDPDTGDEAAGGELDGADQAWVARWWPGAATPGARVELGGTRDRAWARAVAALARGLAVTVDYGHTREARPPLGTLTGFAAGRQARPVPDGSCDITAHVAIDAVRAAGEKAASTPGLLVTQRAALHALGITGTRPPLELAGQDPAGYVRALAAATQATELTDPEGFGGHTWLLQPVGLPANALPAGLRAEP